MKKTILALLILSLFLTQSGPAYAAFDNLTLTANGETKTTVRQGEIVDLNIEVTWHRSTCDAMSADVKVTLYAAGRPVQPSQTSLWRLDLNCLSGYTDWWYFERTPSSDTKGKSVQYKASVEVQMRKSNGQLLGRLQRTWTNTVTVNILQFYTLTVTVTDARTRKAVAGAHILVDGTFICETNSQGKAVCPGISGGKHQLRLTAWGYTDLTKSVNISSNVSYRYSLIRLPL